MGSSGTVATHPQGVLRARNSSRTWARRVVVGVANCIRSVVDVASLLTDCKTGPLWSSLVLSVLLSIVQTHRGETEDALVVLGETLAEAAHRDVKSVRPIRLE